MVSCSRLRRQWAKLDASRCFCFSCSFAARKIKLLEFFSGCSRLSCSLGLVLSGDDIADIDILCRLLGLSLLLPSLQLGLLRTIKLLLKLFRNDELPDSLTITEWVLILFLSYTLNRGIIEQELMLHMVLEPHHYVIPNCEESVQTLTHNVNDASVNVGIEMPAFDVPLIASFDRNGEADWD